VLPGASPSTVFVVTQATTLVYDLEIGAFRNQYLLGDNPTTIPELDLVTNHAVAEFGFNLYIYRAEDFEQLATLFLPEGITGGGSFLPEADLFALSDQAGILRFFDTVTWEQIDELDRVEGFFIVRPEFSRGGHWLLFSWYTYDEFGDYYSGYDVWGIP
jgi:hypothetical protein